MVWTILKIDRHTGVISEIDGSVRKIQKRALFQYKTVKKGIPNLTSPYVYGLFTIVLINQIFGKIKSSRAASRNQTQFKPEINPGISDLTVLCLSIISGWTKYETNSLKRTNCSRKILKIAGSFSWKSNMYLFMFSNTFENKLNCKRIFLR